MDVSVGKMADFEAFSVLYPLRENTSFEKRNVVIILCFSEKFVKFSRKYDILCFCNM